MKIGWSVFRESPILKIGTFANTLLGEDILTIADELPVPDSIFYCRELVGHYTFHHE